jgi:hypothetical protein
MKGDIRDQLINEISASYGVEPTGRDAGTLDSIIEYVSSVISQNYTPSQAPDAYNTHLPDAERLRRTAGAITWSILARLNLRGIVEHDRSTMRAAGYEQAQSDLQLELDEIAARIEDHKMPGDGPRGYVRGLRFAASRARELRHE